MVTTIEFCLAGVITLLGLIMILFPKKIMKKETIELVGEVSGFRKKGAVILVFAIIVLIYMFHKRCDFGYYTAILTFI